MGAAIHEAHRRHSNAARRDRCRGAQSPEVAAFPAHPANGSKPRAPKRITCYLKGRFFWGKRTPDNIRKALDLYQQALDRDPSYAVAYAGIADCYVVLGFTPYGTMKPVEAFPRAKAAAQKALALSDSLAEAHASLGACALLYQELGLGGVGARVQPLVRGSAGQRRRALLVLDVARRRRSPRRRNTRGPAGDGDRPAIGNRRVTSEPAALQRTAVRRRDHRSTQGPRARPDLSLGAGLSRLRLRGGRSTHRSDRVG